jgi:PTH1 family peptidyl-tRNA hydrolase
MSTAIESPEKGRVMIVGLGNPGRAYRHNRHNIGFMLLDKLAAQFNLQFKRQQAKALIAEGRVASHPILMAKPQTFMNESGRSVASLVRFYRLPLSNLIIVFDDLDLPLGTLRMLPAGGTSGHRGMHSIQQSLGTPDYPRLRLGIGRPPGRMDPADYVLQDFARDDEFALEAALHAGYNCLETWLTSGIEAAMSLHNGSQI